MPVDTEHSEYKYWYPMWKKCRDVTEGEEAVKKNTDTYLPKLSGHEDKPASYSVYLNYAWFYNAAGRTVDGLTGMLFRRPPNLRVPDSFSDFIRDVDGTGVPFQGFAEASAEEILRVGRCGVLVDYSPENLEVITDNQDKNYGRRVFWRLYIAESIINWSTTNIDGPMRLDRVVLYELGVRPNEKDEFVDDQVPRYRVLDFDESGFYRQRIYEQVEAVSETTPDGQSATETSDPRQNRKLTWALVRTTYPKMGGQMMREIPFVFIGPRDTGCVVQKPPLLDLVNANLAWYRNCAAYEHGILWTGNPTPVITGHSMEPGEIVPIGSSEALVFAEPDAKAMFMEFTGQGLQAIKEAITTKEQYLAVLGARMLSPDRKQVESAETAQIHRQGETSVLASIAQAISTALTQCLKWTAKWNQESYEDIQVELNRIFLPIPMDSNMITALMQTWQAGGFAYEDLHRLWVRGDLVDPERKPDQIKDDIKDDWADMPDPLLASQAGMTDGRGSGNTKPVTDPETSIRLQKENGVNGEFDRRNTAIKKRTEAMRESAKSE